MTQEHTQTQKGPYTPFSIITTSWEKKHRQNQAYSHASHKPKHMLPGKYTTLLNLCSLVSRVLDTNLVSYHFNDRRLKERKNTLKDGGRPLFNIEIENSEIPSLNSVGSGDSSFSRRSAFSSSTASSSSVGSVRSNRSTSSRSTPSQGSVFDRLAATGTKSSLRKHMKSDTYDATKDKKSAEEDLLRNYTEGSTKVFSSNLHRISEQKRKRIPMSGSRTAR